MRSVAQARPIAAPRLSPLRFVNAHLIVGVVLVGALVFIALFGRRLAQHDPMATIPILEVAPRQFAAPPFAPGEVKGFPLGTDFDGRDTLSRLLWGVRPTLILALSVSVVRLVIGTLLGILEGWYYGRAVGRVIGTLVQVAITVPLLIVAVLLLRFMDPREGGLWPFIIALNITGWASIAQLVSERVRVLRGEQYIEAARALGGRDLHIILRHVLPQMSTLLPILFSFEMGASLLQLAELGFLGFFFGGGAVRMVPNGNNAGFTAYMIPGQPELGQMLSAGWENFFLAPWMAVWAGAAFTAAIFSFMILGEGLKRHYAGGTPAQPLKRLARALIGS